MRETGLDTVTGVVCQRQRNRAGRRNRTVMAETRALFGQLGYQLGFDFCQLLHVAAVTRMQFTAANRHTGLPAVGAHFRAALEHGFGYLEDFIHDRRRSLLFGKLQSGAPAGNRQLAADLLGKNDRIITAVWHSQHRQRRSQAQKAHAVAALAHDFIALLGQG